MEIAVKTFGCQLNQAEGESLKRALLERGFELTEPTAAPDVFVANSCCVTSRAAAKLRKHVRRFRRENQAAEVIFTGCYAEHLAGEVEAELPEVDVVFPGHEKEKIPGYLEQKYPTEQLNKRAATQAEFNTRRTYKIQDGCQNFCSYCIVPHVRSELWSRKPREIEADLLRLANDAGYNEIVLTGAHLGAYGTETADGYDLAALLEELDRLELDCRIRLSSLEPEDATEELVELIATSDLFCNHLFLPVQSGSDAVLERMGRSYSRRDLLELDNFRRSLEPELAINADLMVGFPGETEQDFQATLSLVEELRLSNLHVFRYSERPGTPAAEMENKVHSRVAKERSKQLRELGQSLATAYAASKVGDRGEVVVEARLDSGEWFGYDEFYSPVLIEGNCRPGELVTVEIQAAKSDNLKGKKLKEAKNAQ